MLLTSDTIFSTEQRYVELQVVDLFGYSQPDHADEQK